MHAVGVAEVLPGFVGGEGEHRREQPDQGLGHLAHGRLRGAAARAVGGVAVHAVLGDVDVQRAQLAGDEVVHRGEHLAEVVGGVAVEAVAGQRVQAFENPAVDEGVSRRWRR